MDSNCKNEGKAPGYTLKDVIRSVFCHKETEYGNYRIRVESFGEPVDLEMEDKYADKFTNFYRDREKEFREITSDLRIQKEFDKLKKSDNFSFNEEDKLFLASLFDETGLRGKLNPILRGEPAKAEYSYKVYLYEGFVRIFVHGTDDDDLINQVAKILYNHLDIPVCLLQIAREETAQKLSDMVYKRIHTHEISMGILDKYEWLNALSEDYKGFLRKWDELFTYMRDIRSEEISAHSASQAQFMTDEEAEYAQIQFAYADEVHDAVIHDDKYQELEKEYCKMLGIKYEKPTESKDIDLRVGEYERHFRRPHVKNIEKRFYEVCDLQKKRSLEIEQEVYRRHIPGYCIPDEKEDEVKAEWKTSDEVLKEAIDYQREHWDDDKKLRNAPPIELPDIDFKKLKRCLDTLR